MAIKVMLVDDSTIVRGLLTRALTQAGNMEIVASVMNGVQAIIQAKQHQPDIIILDIEMPEMDGITALPKLLEVSPGSKIIMASTLTVRNANISLQALELGASDYVAKPTARGPEELADFYRDLREKIYALVGTKRFSATPVSTSAIAATPVMATAQGSGFVPGVAKPPLNLPVKALAIASSTGGPQALQKLFGQLKGKLLHIPIFITQHMPPTFTTMLAEHIARAGERRCVEAQDGMDVAAGCIYLAPGDFHMQPEQSGGKVVIRLNQKPPVNFCRPAADPMIESLSRIYGKNLLLAVLTGMGQDGFEGAKLAIAAGGSVIAQDEASSVVWGMPKAVATANLCQAVLPLDNIPAYLSQYAGGG